MLLDDKISVIIPVYNAEKTLEQCIKSILSQTYRNIEIILVNDGSKDNSLEICNRFERLDDRIIVINTENGGASVARNIGIDNSSGEFIAFVDADDYIDKNMYEILIKSSYENDTDLVFCNYKEINNNGMCTIINQFNNIERDGNKINNINIIKRLLSINELSIFGCCWRTLYKKKLIVDNNLKFTPNITMAEDLKFILECLSACKYSSICDESLYYFYNNVDSTTSKYMKYQERDMYTINIWMREFIKTIKCEEELKVNVDICMANTLVINTANLCKKSSPYSFFERIKVIRKNMQKLYYKRALNVAIRNNNKIINKQWIQMLLIYFKLEIIVVLYHSVKYKNFKGYTI